MGRTLTNYSGFQYARQTAFDTLGGSPTWNLVQPNGSIVFWAETTTVPRSPISKNRQQQKGKIVDVDAPISFEADLTIQSALDGAEGFCFSTAVNAEMTFRGSNAVGTTDDFTVAALSAAQAAKIQYNASGLASLFYSAGYVLPINNGVHPVNAAHSSTDVAIQVATDLVNETPATNSELSICGVRGEAGDLAMTITSGVGTITSGNAAVPVAAIDFTALGLTVGQFIHIGGVTSATQAFSAASTPTYGYARIITIAAGILTVDKLEQANAIKGTPALLAFDGTDDNAAGTEVQIDILFGRFVRNVSVDSSDFLEQYFQFEASFPNLFETTPPTPVTNPNGYEYAPNCLSNTWGWNLPLVNKATCNFAYVATDVEPAVDDASRKVNAATPIEPLFIESFNTSSDYARLRIADVDETGITTDFKDWTITFNNNVTAEKVQGQLGAKFLNTGNFQVNIDGSFLFTSPLVTNRIRNNTTVSMDWILDNGDGGIAVDIPAMTLGGGARDYAINESVKVQLTAEAFQDPTLGTSIGVSFFPVTPNSFAN